MSLRRPIIALSLAALVLGGLGLRDWPVEGGRATAFANRTLTAYGLTLTATGPAAFRLLPLPHLTLAGIRLAGAGGASLVEGERLVVDLDPVGFATGASPVAGIRVAGGRISADTDAWAGPLTRIRATLGGGLVPPRLALESSRIADGVTARNIDLDVTWPFWSGALAVKGSLIWRGVPTRLSLTRVRVGDLLQGQRTPFAAEATWTGGSLAVDGTAILPSEEAILPSFSGRARFAAESLPATLAWIGHEAPLAPLAGPFSLEGSFEAEGRAVSWPVLRIGTGHTVMEGAGAFSLGTGEAPRLSVQATLAADQLDLGPLTGALVRLFEEGSAPVALGPLTRGDLDLRMSASEGRIGPLTVADLAASVLVRDAAVEIALNRARVRDGVLKARVTLTSGTDPTETELKAQGGLDQLDLGGLMSDLGGTRWVSGPLQGQFALESRARDAAGLIAGIGGRANLAIEGGALSGLDLADVIHRNGGLAHGALARRNGRTGFERAAVVLRFADGVGEIMETELRGAPVSATLRGQVSLPLRRLDCVAWLAPRLPVEGLSGVRIAISGPWDALGTQGLHGEVDDQSPRSPGEARVHGPLQLPAALGFSGDARAYAP